MVGDFKLAELMRPCRRWKAARTPEVMYHSQQLCWDCANVYGDCEWSLRFEQVPGWDATPIERVLSDGTGGLRVITSYEIRDCPEKRLRR